MVLLARKSPDEDGPAIPPSNDADIALEATDAEAGDLEDGDQEAEAPDIGDGPDNAAAASLFGRVSPAEIENAVYQRISEQPGLRLTTLTSVECGALRCSIVFSGVEANPQYVDRYGDLLTALGKPPWNDYQQTSGSIGTREVSPGVREYVMEFTYIALVNASDDPQIAAQQHAACAGAWARVTQLRGSDAYIRGAHERAAKYLELAAGTLGFEEAQRLADSMPFGPLTRDCGALPY